jgi:UDP-N-acetylmuramate dehydrogenase
MTASALHRVAQRLGDRARHQVPLGPLTTYRVGGWASLAVVVDHDDDLEAVAQAVAAETVELVVVGRGSNLLIADGEVAVVAVQLGSVADWLHIEGRRVRAGGGVALPVLARRTVAAGLTGLEWAVGVPGSVGGAVRMNAGGHGSDMAATLHRVEVADLGRGDRRWLAVEELGLRFRGSDLTDHQVVTAAEFILAPGDRRQGDEMLAEIVRWRREHQPGGHNAGSVFVNPVPGGLSAGELIDAAGLRGLRRGSAEVSTKHANFIQVDEGGRAHDVAALMLEVRAAVGRRHGIWLRSEIRLVGFPRDLTATLTRDTP